MTQPATTATDGDRTLVVTRSFHADRPRIWRAYTDAALVPQWLLGPLGWEMHVCEMDVRPGGTYRWRWRHPDQGEFGFTGTYDAIEVQASIGDRQVFDPGSLGLKEAEPTVNTVRLADAPEGTRVVTQMTFATADLMETARAQGMTDGMEMSYQRLDQLITEGVI